MQLQRSVEPARIERSGIPKVVGILAIVFASLGLLVTLVIPWGIHEELPKHGLTTDALGTFWTWTKIWIALSVGLFGLHLTGGILAVYYARRAPLLLTIYGALALALAIAGIVLSMTTFPSGLSTEAFDDTAGPGIGLAVLSVPWPIVVLALINQRSARRSCGQPTG